ncbi:MAG: diguanylate cyclase [Anaerolineae bacterium]|nr:diguanylate cyclase [Anaerolineae bacterium]
MKKTDTLYKSKPVILVVDDTLTGRHAIVSALEGKEYELSLASNGMEALSLATRLEPDVILLDVMMPDLSGYDVCRQIRSNPSLREVPILMVTSLADREERLRGIASGADDFISKPFDPMELNARVRNITRLNRYRKLRDGNRQLISMKRDLAILENKKVHLQKLAMVDDLTKLHNRRSLLRKGRDEFDPAKRYETNLSALMIDIDKFKSINDTFGHRVGSFIIKSLAIELKGNLRSMDIAGRLGGDEFCVLLPHTSLNFALTLAERLRKSIETRVFTAKKTAINITISVGASTLSPSMNNVMDLMESADVALYKAKVRRNSVA